MLRLEKVNVKNVWELLKLKVLDDQKSFVASNDTNIVEAYIANGYAFPFGIYDGDVPVGFLMIGFDIDDYNSEQDRATIEKTFMELMDLANQMSYEEQRYVREGFTSDEELSLYDMLFRDDLSNNNIKKLKEVAATLLKKIKGKIAELDHWTDKQETKAEIDKLIRDTLWEELPECYDEVSISMYRRQIYEYVYTRYREIA